MTPTSTHRYLNLAAMVVPSNDTFFSLGTQGVALLDENGNPRSETDIQIDVSDLLRAWDAGTEINQAGGAGPDQAPRQSGPDTGPAEGNGVVRKVDDSVWSYPTAQQILRVTVRLLEP